MKRFNIILDEVKFAKEVLDGKHKYIGAVSSAKYVIRHKYKDFVFDGKLNDVKLYEYVMDFLLSIFPKDELVDKIPIIKKYVSKYSNSNFDLD
jgi:hypothetical protein